MEVGDQLHGPADLPQGKEHPVAIEEDAECAQQAVWTLWREEKSPVPARN